jgi:cyclopropane-fatty-acyl-phospholipid synthase
MIFTTTKGQIGLPRYFSAVFQVLGRLNRGRLDFVIPDGRRFRAEGRLPGPTGELVVQDPDIFARLIREGDVGFCEAYMDGGWSSPDLQSLLDCVVGGNDEVYNGFPGFGLVRALERFRFWLRSNTKSGSRRNIAQHYDLGNDFYRLWLDETMTYSSALFVTGQESLERAQELKYTAMVDQMGVKPGDHVLEIGCGWGGFAEYAARERGLRLTCLTISREQHRYAVERMARAGLSDQVEVKLQDYRDEKGVYDAIASIEMFEAVGEKFWPVYFDILRNCLKSGARATLQVITIREDRFSAYRKGVDFIQKYIFPGGMLPSPSALRQEAERAGLALQGSVEFGKSYDITLRRWFDQFNQNWAAVQALGFDERFKRMWNLYLTSCASSFQSGNCGLTQITFVRP